jgi:hypothetical protein
MLSKATLVSRKKFRKNLEIKSPKFWPWELVATVYRLPLPEPSPDPQQCKEHHCTEADENHYWIGQSVTHGPIIPPSGVLSRRAETALFRHRTGPGIVWALFCLAQNEPISNAGASTQPRVDG